MPKRLNTSPNSMRSAAASAAAAQAAGRRRRSGFRHCRFPCARRTACHLSLSGPSMRMRRTEGCILVTCITLPGARGDPLDGRRQSAQSRSPPPGAHAPSRCRCRKRSRSSFRAAARSAPIRPACSRASRRRGSRSTGSPAFRSARSMPRSSAGNPPEQRVAKLRAFWEKVTSALARLAAGGRRAVARMGASAVGGLRRHAGRPRLLQPAPLPPTMAPAKSAGALSFYDSAPLAATLDAFVDWDLLNDGPVRLSVGAVDVETGNFHYFDTSEGADRRAPYHGLGRAAAGPAAGRDRRRLVVGRRHRLQHAAEPRARPAEGGSARLPGRSVPGPRRAAGDDHGRLCAREGHSLFQPHPPGHRPAAPPAEGARGDPQGAGQASRRPRRRSRRRSARRASPPSMRSTSSTSSTASMAGKAAPRDFEFSRATMEHHWREGLAAIAETMRHDALLARNIVDGRTAAFDLAA